MSMGEKVPNITTESVGLPELLKVLEGGVAWWPSSHFGAPLFWTPSPTTTVRWTTSDIPRSVIRWWPSRPRCWTQVGRRRRICSKNASPGHKHDLGLGSLDNSVTEMQQHTQALECQAAATF